jgi:hypothetical protein
MSDRTVVILRGLRGLLVLGVLLAFPAVAQAATVTTLKDNAPGSPDVPGSLRDLIDNSSAGETIDFAPGLHGTITLTSGVLAITQSVTITGPGAGTITINGNHTTTVFDIAPNVVNQDVTISGLTITGGTATTDGAGILANDLVRTLTLSGDRITGNQVSITDPASASGGAGVYINGGTLVVNSSTITGNSVTLTGAGSDASGGAGLYSNGGAVTLTGSDVSNNTVHQSASTGSSGGAGIYSDGGDVDAETSTVDNNTDTVDSSTGGSDGGGGIYSNGGTVTLGAAHLDGNTFTLTTTTDGHNGGGGVYSNGGEVDVVTSSVDANTLSLTDTSTAGSDGGGGVFSNGGAVLAEFASISENTATVAANGTDNGGGGVFDDGAKNAYLSSTFSDNSITVSGSGAQSSGGGAIRSLIGGVLSNTTIAGNSINASGGGVFLEDAAGTYTLEDTIVAGNSPTNCAGPGTFQSSGFNLESANTCHLNAAGDLSGANARLGPLQNNGGPTPTQALGAGSPAIDAGACTDVFGAPLTVDQRGIARPQPAGGKCDIGAYELVPGTGLPSSPVVVPASPAAVNSTSASFSGSVNPNGQATTVFFQYGIDSRYRPGGGTAVIYDQSTAPQSLPADSAVHAVAASASGLVPNALYHVRLVASNATGTAFGPDQTFTTPTGPPPPPPVLGHSVNVEPVSGQVFILVGKKLVPLTQARQLPSGAVVDARHGSLELTAAAGRHKHQTGTFGGAVFKLTQARNALTTLSLAEGAFPGAPSFARCKSHKAGEARAAASRRTLQLLHASARGKFRTRGRYSAATVRGTKWTIADRCDGTLTHDIVHSVVVSDFVRHRTVLLHPGQSYLAKAPRHK